MYLLQITFWQVLTVIKIQASSPLSLGLYNCRLLRRNLHKCQTYTSQFSVSIWEVTKRTNKESTIYREKNSEDLSAVRKICVAVGQIKTLNKSMGEKDSLHLCNIKLIRTAFMHSFRSTLILEVSNEYHHCYNCFCQNQPSVWGLVNIWYLWFYDIDVVHCSLTSHHIPKYSLLFWQKAGTTNTSPQDLFPTLKWSCKSFIASLIS